MTNAIKSLNTGEKGNPKNAEKLLSCHSTNAQPTKPV
jgi:hypothetical protein